MTPRLGLALLMGMLLTTAAAGALIKRAGEVVKPPSPTQPQPGGPVQQSSLGCPVDDAAMDRLLKALEAQRAERDAALKEAAAGKTDAEYDACLVDVALSPEAEKILASFDPANPGSADAAAVALNRAKCGPPPVEVRKTLEDRYEAAAKLVSDCDARVEEHAYRFCQLPPAEQAAAQKGGVRVPGFGSTFWVFTEAEAKAYAPRCARLMSLMDARAAQGKQLEGLRQ